MTDVGSAVGAVGLCARKTPVTKQKQCILQVCKDKLTIENK